MLTDFENMGMSGNFVNLGLMEVLGKFEENNGKKSQNYEKI